MTLPYAADSPLVYWQPTTCFRLMTASEWLSVDEWLFNAGLFNAGCSTPGGDRRPVSPGRFDTLSRRDFKQHPGPKPDAEELSRFPMRGFFH